MTTTNSRRVKGESAPAWLGAALLVVGLGSWTGAGAAAQARAPNATVATEDGDGVAPVTETVPHEQPAAPHEAQDEVVVAKAAPEADSESPHEACAPTVELRFAQGATDVADAEALRTIVAATASFESRKIVVEGYASAAGPSHKNLQLSHRRARRAKAKLVAQGIDPKRITLQAFGEYRPNLGGDENRDRRVVVKIQGMPSCPDEDGEEVAQ